MIEGASVVVRPVRADDVPAVVALVAAVLGEFGLTFGEGSGTDDQLRALPGAYEDAGGAFWVAAREDGALVGTCGVAPLDAETFELRKMYLDPQSRGLGLGRRLLEVALAFVRDRGARRVVLDTTEQMARAIAFYEAHGFVRDDAQVRGSRCSRGYVLHL